MKSPLALLSLQSQSYRVHGPLLRTVLSTIEVGLPTSINRDGNPSQTLSEANLNLHSPSQGLLVGVTLTGFTTLPIVFQQAHIKLILPYNICVIWVGLNLTGTC